MNKRGTVSNLNELLVYLALFVIIAVIILFVLKEKIFTGAL